MMVYNNNKLGATLQDRKVQTYTPIPKHNDHISVQNGGFVLPMMEQPNAVI